MRASLSLGEKQEIFSETGCFSCSIVFLQLGVSSQTQLSFNNDQARYQPYIHSIPQTLDQLHDSFLHNQHNHPIIMTILIISCIKLRSGQLSLGPRVGHLGPHFLKQLPITGCFFHWAPPKISKYRKVNQGQVRCIQDDLRQRRFTYYYLVYLYIYDYFDIT